MSDRIAVMNRGVIEQVQAPEDVYERPRTTFVANFLGQSNLIRGEVTPGGGQHLRIDVEGIGLRVPRDRAAVESGGVWLGIRPEKVFLAAAGSETQDASNVLRGGVVTDVSFSGVSTQYLARMAWGQELMVFEQNTGARQSFRVGDHVDLHWMPDHTFLLDAWQDASAGVEREDIS